MHHLHAPVEQNTLSVQQRKQIQLKCVQHVTHFILEMKELLILPVVLRSSKLVKLGLKKLLKNNFRVKKSVILPVYGFFSLPN